MTIDEIARMTGYSRATVVRALSGKGYCGKDKKEEILRVAKEGGYRPNYSARCLREDKTNRILVCLPNFNNSFYFDLVSGLTEKFAESGYCVMLFDSGGDSQKELESINMLNQKYCDGLVFVSLDFNDDNIAAVRASGRPVVLTNRYLGLRDDDNFDYVYLDHEKAMYKATTHLIDCGCKRIALFVGNDEQQTSRERTQGYYAALNERGIAVDKSLVVDAGFKEDVAATKFAELAGGGADFDGVIAASDLMGMGIYRAAKSCNLQIGRDFKMVSFDNTDFTTIATPGITSIDMRQREIGANAAMLLTERIRGRKQSKTVVLEPRVIVRDSSR